MIDHIRRAFPSLRDFSVTSPRDSRYNCIAWAAGDDSKWWWPESQYWPVDAPADTSVAAFEAAFRLLGYEPCPGGSFDEGYEKVAVYAASARVEHMARQLPNGRWTSKLGRAEDIEHAAPAELEGEAYGAVAMYMRRPIASAPSPRSDR